MKMYQAPTLVLKHFYLRDILHACKKHFNTRLLSG